MNTKLFWGHLEFLYQGLVPSAPAGSIVDYKNKLDTIAHTLPGIFDTSGDVNSKVSAVALNAFAAATTDLVTRTTERDTERKARQEAEAKLLTWENNKVVILKYLKDERDFKEMISKLTADHVIAKPANATEVGVLETDVKNIDTIIVEVSGLAAKKDALKALVRSYLIKYDTAAWKGETEVEKIAGKGNVNLHWGDGARKTSTKDNWEGYVDTIVKEGSTNDGEYDFVREGLLMGMHETIVPELIRRHYVGEIKKKELVDYRADAKIYLAGFFDATPSNAKVNNTILDVIDTGLKAKKYDAIIDGLIDKVNWNDKLTEIKTYLGTFSRTTTIANVRTWATAKLNTDKPLDGIDLNGATKTNLRTLTAGTKVAGATGKADFWNNYDAFTSKADGNCFLNSFAILLTGKQIDDATAVNPESQQHTALRLRVAMCLNLMAKKDWMGNDALTLSRPDSKYDGWNANVWEIHRKLLKAKYTGTAHNDVAEEEFDAATGKWSVNGAYAGATDGSMATNKTWLSNQDVSYMALLLDRPTTVVHKGTSPTTGGILATTFTWELSNLSKFSHEEPMVVYNATDNHYEPLVQPDDHMEGKFKFNVGKTDPVVFDKSTGTAATVTFTFGTGADDKLKASLLSVKQNTRLSANLANATSLVITMNYDADAAGEKAWYDEKAKVFVGKSNRRFMVTICHMDKINVVSNVAQVPFADFVEVDLLPLPKFDGIETLPTAITDKDEAHVWYIEQLKSKLRWWSFDADDNTKKDWKAFNVLLTGDVTENWEDEIKKTTTAVDAKKYVETDNNFFGLVEELTMINSLKEITGASLPTAIINVDEAKAWFVDAIIARGFKLEKEVQDGGAKENTFTTELGITGKEWHEAINDVAITTLLDLKNFIDNHKWIEKLRAAK